jgi:hypothetical protein
MKLFVLRVPAVLALAALAIGCGGDDSPPPEDCEAIRSKYIELKTLREQSDPAQWPLIDADIDEYINKHLDCFK